MPAAVTEVWDAAQLMGTTTVSVEEQASSGPHSNGGKPGSVNNKKGGKQSDQQQNPLLWGVPGHLTQAESDVYFKFKDVVVARGGEFRETVYSFGEEEGEVWALCRWLRARKFVFEDVVKMVEEATEVRKEAKAKDFYPNPVEALGVDPSVFFAQYPQLYSGVSKLGVPIFISKPGILNVDGIECITTLDGIIMFHWHVMMHDFANRLLARKKENPDGFKRFECFCILDLGGLTTSQLSSRALAIVKEQAAIDSICFPETMHKMLIVNAPTFFSATWRLIRGWLDPRTANKIEVISNKAAYEKRLLELIEADQLPSDYGGTATATDKTLQESMKGDADRLETRMLYLRGHGSEVIDVEAGESLDLDVWTRSTAGAKFSVTDATSKQEICPSVEVKHNGTEDVTEIPTTGKITPCRIDGPRKVKVKADSNAGRFSRHNFLLVFSHYKKG